MTQARLETPSSAATAAGYLAETYRQARRTTEDLCSTLTVDDHMVQSMTEASPAKWHLAHTTWFYEAFLLTPRVKDYRPLDPAYQYIFNSYYKAVGGHPLRQTRGTFSRPTLEEVGAYRRHVDAAMLRWLEAGVSAELAALVILGLNHEQQHQELLVTDIKHVLWSNPLRPVYRESAPSQNCEVAPALRWHSYPEGLRWIGHAGGEFAYDNEGPRHQTYLRGFQLASRPATNGEYLEFMRDGGYRRPELWLSDGWDTVNSQGWSAPLYWEERNGEWRVYTCTGTREVNPHEPVCHVSYYEADAFARWAGARLATEAEWESVAANIATIADVPAVNLSDANLLECGLFHPTVAPSQAGKTQPAQLFGDVWEWTQSAYSPYPGFRAAEGALGEYNGKFMCNQMVLRGGSCATPKSHIRATYRNFFPPQAQWQFSGIRLAKEL